MMNTFWVLISVMMLVLVKRMGLSRAAAWTSDLGSVSDRWVTEHRLAETSDHG
jgi:hypothetical protein